MAKGNFMKMSIVFAVIGVFVWPAALNAAVLISEIMYDLDGGDTDREWVEIYNAGSESVTIVEGSGDNSWRFNDGSNHIFALVRGSLMIPPAGTAVLVDDAPTFLIDHPGFSGTLIDTTMSLNNTSDTLKLSSDKGATFFGEITYQNTWGGNGDGKSLEKINLGGGNDQSNWRASAAVGGTPGTADGSASGSSESTSTQSSDPGLAPAPSGGFGSASLGSDEKILKAEAGADVFIEAGKPIALSGLQSIGADLYKWYMGDGATRDGAEITYTYQFPGTYLVTLEVESGGKITADQLRVFAFGGKAVISEFFMGNSSTTGQWIEIYNPNNEILDMSGWILSAGNKNFIVPAFVIIPKGGYLVFSQQTTELDLSAANKISVKYPNGLPADEVVFDENIAEYSANRTQDGFFWSKETSPGRPNIVLSSSAGISDWPAVIPIKVAIKNEESSKNYIASFYSSVESLKEKGQPAIVSTANVSEGFTRKMFGSIMFWIAAIIVFGVFAGLFYFRLAGKSKSR